MSIELSNTPCSPVSPLGFGMVQIELLLTGATQELVPEITSPDDAYVRIILVNQSATNIVSFGFGVAAVLNRGLTLGCLGVAANVSGQHIWDSGIGVCPGDAINVIGTAGQRVTALIYSRA